MANVLLNQLQTKFKDLFQEQKKFLTELAAYTSFCTGKGIVVDERCWLGHL